MSNEIPSSLKDTVRRYLEKSDFEFFRDKEQLEKSLSDYLRISIQETSLLWRMSVVCKECGGIGLYGNELFDGNDQDASEDWNMSDMGYGQWIVYYTPSLKAKVPLIPWNRIIDIRSSLLTPLAKDIVLEFDGKLLEKIHELLYHTDNEDDSPWIVNSDRCKAFHRSINLKDIVDNVDDNFYGWVVVNEDTAKKLSEEKESFVKENPENRKDPWFMYTPNRDMIPDNLAYIVPKGSIVLEQAQFPSVCLNKQFHFFERFAGGIYRTRFDDSLKSGIKVLNFGCELWDDETKTIKEESNQ